MGIWSRQTYRKDEAMKNTGKIIVTGGAGFIGSAFVRLILKRPSVIARSSAVGGATKQSKVIIIDKLTYAGDLKRLQEAKGKFKFYKTDICDKKQINFIFAKERPEIVVHFAAESHVDHSINDATPFIETNIKGTQILIDASRKYGIKKFIFISTDEVYGDIKKGKFSESSPFKPSSPYAASKAAADLLVQSYIRTYKFPAIIVRPSNNYGPWQYPEKLIPLAILKILKNEKVPIYAKGENVREWLYVDDCVRGIFNILNDVKESGIYNLGSNQEWRNIDVIATMLTLLNRDRSMIEFVKDRLGHDIRYRLDSTKIFKELNWTPKAKFKDGLKQTINWYLENREWLLSK
jgi:dTDP-glucose 4,6-dehydratase